MGLRLDGGVDWGEVEEVCEDAYRAVAPKRLVALLEGTRRQMSVEWRAANPLSWRRPATPG